MSQTHFFFRLNFSQRVTHRDYLTSNNKDKFVNTRTSLYFSESCFFLLPLADILDLLQAQSGPPSPKCLGSVIIVLHFSHCDAFSF